MMSIKPEIVFVLGAPGCGKGTQSKLICDEFGFKHLSAGDLLREERNNPNSDYGELIETYIRNGSIVPNKITCSLLENAMIKHMNNLYAGGDVLNGNKINNKFLIDGFPRNSENLNGWIEQMSDKVIVKFLLYLDCPDDVCVERCLERGRSGSKRSDDNEDSLRKRLVTYYNDTLPIIKLCEEKYYPVKRVSAIEQPQMVYNEVRKLFLAL